MKNAVFAAFLATGMWWSACSESTGPERGGQVIWSVPSAGIGTPFSPTANADRSMIYFATPEMRLKKIRANNGTVAWDVSIGAPRAVPPGWRVVQSADVVAVSNVHVYAYDTATGAPRWAYAAPGDEQAGYFPLASDDSTIYAGTNQGRVYALHAKTGAVKWVADLRQGKATVAASNPTVSSDAVFVCSKDFTVNPTIGALWALNVANGSVKWSYHFTPERPDQGSACYGSPAVLDDIVVEPAQDGRVYAFDRATGSVKWTAPAVHHPVSKEDIRWAAAASGVVLVTSLSVPGMIVAHDAATGEEKWRRTENGGSLYPPVLDATAAFVDHGWFFASYDLATGTIRWRTPRSESDPEAVFKGRPIVSGDRVYVGGRDGSYALRR